MNDHGDGLLRIGLFSTLTTISVRMLRHYQDQGVLVPAVIDPFTGHRYYRPDQVVTGHWVVRLRDAGFPVAEIRWVLDNRDDPDTLRDAMAARQSHLDADRARLDGQTAAFNLISTYLQESTMDINVRTIHLPAMTVASLRRVLASYADEGTLWHEIGTLMAQSGTRMPDHDEGIGGATFHDPDYRETDTDVEVWLQVAAPFEPVPPLTCRELPAREVVVATLLGSYEGMSQVTAAIGAYLAARQLRTGPMFNIYRVSPAQNPDPASWVTDVCFPIDAG